MRGRDSGLFGSSRKFLLSLNGLACLLIIAAFCVLAFWQAGDPLHLDNFDFPAVAQAVTHSGLPIYYRGEDLPQHSGLYHPPLYIYMLAGWFDVFGVSPMTARAFTIVCGLLSGILALGMYQTIFGRRLTARIAPAFFVLYLLNPFALQVFAIEDIDTSILPPLFIVAIWAVLRLVFTDGHLRKTPVTLTHYSVSVFTLFLCLWAKLTTPLLLPPIIFGILQIRFGLIKAALQTAALCLLAFALFAGSFTAYGAVTGLDTSYTWQFLAESLISKSVGGTSLLAKLDGYATRLFSNFKSLGRWDTFLVLASAVAAAMLSLKLAYRSEGIQSRWQAAWIVVLGGLAVVLFYCLITLPFGGAPFKYIAPAWPLLALAAASIALRAWQQAPLAKYELGLAAAGGFLIGVFYLRDRSILGETNLVWLQYTVGPAAAFVIASLSLILFRKTNRGSQFANMTALLTICWLAATGFGRAVAQSRADYAKQYDYGQRGFREARDWIATNTAPDEVIMSMKDIASAAQRRYLENYGYLLGNPPIPVMEERLNRLKVSVFVFTETHGQDQLVISKDLAQWIAANTQKIKEFGDYRIYLKNK
jgi:hypothetical protein